MTTPSPEERLRRLTANPGQPATKADIAELWSAIRIRDIERRSEMNRRESERNIRAIEFQSEMNRREIEFRSEMRRRGKRAPHPRPQVPVGNEPSGK